MASLITIKLNKNPGTSWGFRLQGGKDFATPLCIQKVNVGSVAERAGLQAGDAIVSIAGQDALTFRHKEAQDSIVHAGNNFEIVIQRGSQIWRPTVTALPEVKTLPDGVPVATKTSLAATQKTHRPIGTGYNKAAAPFGEHLVNAQYNSPLNLYSDDSIAETLSAQAEVLGKGVLGVNFMKNDKSYDGRSSDVLRMVHEMDKEPQIETPGTPTHSFGHDDKQVAQGQSFKLLQRVLESGDDPSVTLTRSVYVPQTQSGQSGGGSPRVLTNCSECERPIIGVFVRVKNKNLHADCFKCSTCGSSLKNVGYYNINDKLYCDIHAKQAARANPPAPNMEPIIVKPGAIPPAGALTAPQASKMKIPSAFQHGGPAPAPVSGPVPFKPPSGGVKLLPSSPSALYSPAPFKRAAAPPAPHQPYVPAPAPAPAPVAAAPMKPASAPGGFSTSANPQAFGAPAGDINVRSHIPKKGDGQLPMSYAPTPAPISSFASSSMPKPTPLPDLGGKIMGPSAPFMRGVPQPPGHRSAPRRGRGVMNQASASRIPMCNACHRQIRGPFVSALGKTWCPDHFICATSTCKRNIIDMGFVEEQGLLYCELCYESYLAPICGKCDKRIKGDCLNAVGKQFHPECFCCAYCGKVFGSGAFYLEDGLPYCETDWNDLFTTKCVGCNFPIEAGDRWVEALNNNYHSQCFKCSKCQKNLEGQSFFAKGGKPFCKTHAQRGF